MIRWKSSVDQMRSHSGMSAPQRGQNPRPFHEKATSRSSPVAAHRTRAKPAARQPHRRKSRITDTRRGPRSRGGRQLTLRRAKGPYFRIYDLRSTYATRLSAGGMADEWVTQLLRQGDAEVFKKYSQMDCG